MRRITALLLAVSLGGLSLPGTAVEQKRDTDSDYRPSAEAMIVDGLIVRPLSFAGTIIGTGLFIVTLPFSVAGGNVDEAGNALVVEPARATFGPCLGCLPYRVRYYDIREEDEAR